MRSWAIGWERIPQGHPAPQVEATADQFRASLQRHLGTLIEEEEGGFSDGPIGSLQHRYAASLLREIKAWIEAES
jgi:hypothetical protein